MTNSLQVLRVGTRNSRLARLQTEQVINYLSSRIPFFSYSVVEFSSPGDRDQIMDLRTSPPDFFTKDLDDALLNESIDAAVHSAKDMPPQPRNELDWCWLPVREDPRDAVILPSGKSFNDIPSQPRIGISSDRREQWCRNNFPNARLLPIRGAIEKRLEQLDKGDYDLVIMAGAALIRLGLHNRISKWIESNDLQVPDGQGVLALTFRKQDPFWTTIRKFFVKPVIFAGAGCGRASTATLETIDALRNAEVCIYDALFDRSLLDNLPVNALKIDAGKRLGEHTLEQSAINALIADYSRRGLQVVRLKGGDPGIFGRLAEETDTLDNYSLPYLVYPGISSLQISTTGTGILLTRRGLSRGFCVMTPRSEGGKIASVSKSERSALPQVYFMGVSSVHEICSQLSHDGTSPETKAAVIFSAGSPSEHCIKGTIASLPSLIDKHKISDPGIIIIGEVAGYSFRSHGALAGKRVLVTCSDALQETAARSIIRYGGKPVIYPAITLSPCDDGLKDLETGEKFDWIILTSPSAVHSTMKILSNKNLDIRCLPPIIVSGTGTSNALKQYHLKAAIVPDKNFGAEGIINSVRKIDKNQKILRLRSDVAGEKLAQDLRELGFTVADRIICKNVPVHSGPVPEFDAILFASSSAVSSLLDRNDPVTLTNKSVLAIGSPTVNSLAKRNVINVLTGTEALIENVIESFALHTITNSLQDFFTR